MSIVYIFEASVSKYSGNRIALPAEGLSGEAQEVPWEKSQGVSSYRKQLAQVFTAIHKYSQLMQTQLRLQKKNLHIFLRISVRENEYLGCYRFEAIL